MKKRLAHIFHTHFSGSGEAYTLVLLGLVAAASYLVTGGLLPDIEQNPVDVEHVQIDDTTASSDKTNLQLVNIGIKADVTPGQDTPTPTELPTPTDEPTPTTGPGTPTPTPKPTRTPTPTKKPTPTPTDKLACLNNTAFDLLVDLSRSMENNGKAKALQDALKAFQKSINDNTVVGIQAFGSPSTFSGGADVELPFTKNNTASSKKKIADAIVALRPGDFGGTYMKSGFELSLQQIRDAKQDFPGYRFVTILFSDGVPEVNESTGSACVAEVGDPSTSFYKCFAKAQDPRIDGLDEDMDRAVYRVYSVAIYDDTEGTLDEMLIGPLQTLLQDVATKSTSPYYQDTTIKDPSKLTAIFTSIAKGVCK